MMQFKYYQDGGAVSIPWGYSPRTSVPQVNKEKTIYDQSLIEGLSTLLQRTSNIGDLSKDKHLGGKEINRYFDAKKFNASNEEKDTFKNYMNNRNNDEYLNSPQYKYDQQVMNGMIQRAYERDARYDPLTGNKFYYGEKGYDQGVSANDWQTANQEYTTARDAYAKSLIEQKYRDQLKKSLNDSSAFDQEKYGIIGDKGLSKENVYRLIQYAGDDAASGLTLGKGKALKDYSGTQFEQFKFGDNSKAAFARALDYYKSNNPALYNAIIKTNNYTNFLNEGKQYKEITDPEFTPDEMNNWWNTKGKNDKGIVSELNGLVNNTSEVTKYMNQQRSNQQQKNTPKQYSVSDITLSFKQGGKMNKYQQGGQAPTAAQMVLQALSAAQQGDQSGLQQLFSDKKTAQAVIQQLQKEAQEGSEEAIQALEALKQIMSGSKKQATMAQKGAKLSYIHRLATGCPPGMEMTYFKKGGRLCKACIEKAKKAKEGASLDNIIAKNKERYPGITNDQAAGRAPIRKNGKDYYLGGDGVLSEAPQRGKYGFGGFFEYFKCGGKPKKPKCGTKAKCGAELEKCGGKTPMDKCGGKTPMTKCGGKAPMDKCGGKTTLAKCGTELKKCGGKAKKSSPKKPVVNKDKCGGKAKKHAIGGNLELLKYMILNYNK